MKAPSGEAPNLVRHVRVGRRGRRARSGEQFASWETTYGRARTDGYPTGLWDLRTGTIDRRVAEDFKAHDWGRGRAWASLYMLGGRVRTRARSPRSGGSSPHPTGAPSR